MATFKELEDLCLNRARLSELELVSTLKNTQIDPDVFAERDELFGRTVLHLAAKEGRSSEFCKVLHNMDATLVKTQDNRRWIPVHWACCWGRVETAIYLFELYPDSISIATNLGSYPLHFAASNMKINENEALGLISFLLEHDKGAVSTPDSNGHLPLHNACKYREESLAVVKLLFDAHPDGTFIRNNAGDDPNYPIAIRTHACVVRMERLRRTADVVHFLQTQLEFCRQAQDDLQPDSNGQLPIHRVLQNENVLLGTIKLFHRVLQREAVSLGGIKLMVSAHPGSVAVADNQGCTPLHIACHFGTLDIVKYLVQQDEISLTTADSMGNLPLHHACLGGKPDIVNLILEIKDFGVSVENDEGKLPLELLLYDAVCDRESIEYVESIMRLIQADPSVIGVLLSKIENVSRGLNYMWCLYFILLCLCAYMFVTNRISDGYTRAEL